MGRSVYAGTLTIQITKLEAAGLSKCTVLASCTIILSEQTTDVRRWHTGYTETGESTSYQAYPVRRCRSSWTCIQTGPRQTITNTKRSILKRVISS